MKAEGIVLPDSELGWWLKEKVGLDALRKQLLEIGELLRLFRDLRLQDPLYPKGPKMFTPSGASSTAPSSGSSAAPSSSFSTASSAAPSLPCRFLPRQAQVAETAGEDAGGDDHLADEAAEGEGAGGGEPTLED